MVQINKKFANEFFYTNSLFNVFYYLLRTLCLKGKTKLKKQNKSSHQILYFKQLL